MINGINEWLMDNQWVINWLVIDGRQWSMGNRWLIDDKTFCGLSITHRCHNFVPRVLVPRGPWERGCRCHCLFMILLITHWLPIDYPPIHGSLIGHVRYVWQRRDGTGSNTPSRDRVDVVLEYRKLKYNKTSGNQTIRKVRSICSKSVFVLYWLRRNIQGKWIVGCFQSVS